MADNNINLNGAGVTVSGSNQVALYSKNGNITINAVGFGDIGSSAIIYAPNCTVTINTVYTDFHGYVIANRVVVNGAYMNFNGTDYHVTALPASKGHVKLIK